MHKGTPKILTSDFGFETMKAKGSGMTHLKCRM